jgi:hypothetical protein
VTLAWTEMVDLGTDYGLPPEPSETPRAYSARLRGSALLGEEGGMDDAAHRAAAALTREFERQQYGPPAEAGAPAADVPAAAKSGTDQQSARRSQLAAARIEALETALRGNSTVLRRLRALWLPPSVVNRLGRLLAAPFRTVGTATAKTARAAARTLSARWSGGS